MPELPEVETVVRQLRPRLCGGKVLSVSVIDRKLKLGLTSAVIGSSIVSVERVGKHIVLVLEKRKRAPRRYLSFHLRMTGNLLWEAEENPKALRATVLCNTGRLDFVDTRRFGTMRMHETLSQIKPQALDPMSKRFTLAELSGLLRSTRQPIKPWLIRQDKLTGIGNIYASEILFVARINPFTETHRLTEREQVCLYRATKQVLEAAIRLCGTTFSDFQGADGTDGSFQRFLKVYEREGKPCRRCKTTVKRVVQQGRSTYYCPSCQRTGR